MESTLVSVNGYRPATALALVTLPRDEALAIAEKTGSADLAQALSRLQKPSELATLVALVPADRIPVVLAQDTRVFETARSYAEFPDSYDPPMGTVEPLRHAEYESLKKAGHGRWLVPVQHNDFGDPVVWGLRSSLTNIRQSEALERLEAILEADNDDAWKGEALRGLPSAYIEIAIRYACKQHDNRIVRDEIMEAIGKIVASDPDSDGDLVGQLEACESCSDDELHTKLVEERETLLESVKTTIVLTEAASEAAQNLSQRRSVKDLLNSIRGG